MFSYHTGWIWRDFMVQLIVIEIVTFVYFQTVFKKGHRRTPSDLEWMEKTRLDAKEAMKRELSKILMTVPADKTVR